MNEHVFIYIYIEQIYTIGSLSSNVTLHKRNDTDACGQQTVPEPGQEPWNIKRRSRVVFW